MVLNRRIVKTSYMKNGKANTKERRLGSRRFSAGVLKQKFGVDRVAPEQYSRRRASGFRVDNLSLCSTSARRAKHYHR
jgi:hypothetical protein